MVQDVCHCLSICTVAGLFPAANLQVVIASPNICVKKHVRWVLDDTKTPSENCFKKTYWNVNVDLAPRLNSYLALRPRRPWCGGFRKTARRGWTTLNRKKGRWQWRAGMIVIPSYIASGSFWTNTMKNEMHPLRVAIVCILSLNVSGAFSSQQWGGWGYCIEGVSNKHVP